MPHETAFESPDSSSRIDLPPIDFAMIWSEIAGILFVVLLSLFFLWLFPILICQVLWRKQAPEKPSLRFVLLLYPVGIFGLFFGDFVARAIYPELFSARGDNPSQVIELTIALLMSWTLQPVLERLARMKQPNYQKPKLR